MPWQAGIVDRSSIRELEALQQELARLLREVDPNQGLEESMTLALGMLHRFAAGIVHVDTGRLKNSLHWQTHNTQKSVFGSMGTNVSYSVFENARGGTHAFMDRTEREEGRNVADIFNVRIVGRGQ